MSKAWKVFESRVATVFGCRRRGPDHRDGRDDLTHEHFAVECKLLTRPTWDAIVKAVKQSERNANGREPLAIIKAKGSHDANALVIMRLDTFAKWRL